MDDSSLFFSNLLMFSWHDSKQPPGFQAEASNTSSFQAVGGLAATSGASSSAGFSGSSGGGLGGPAGDFGADVNSMDDLMNFDTGQDEEFDFKDLLK